MLLAPAARALGCQWAIKRLIRKHDARAVGQSAQVLGSTCGDAPRLRELIEEVVRVRRGRMARLAGLTTLTLRSEPLPGTSRFNPSLEPNGSPRRAHE